MKSSFIPDGVANLAIINKNINKNIELNLKKYFKYIIYTHSNDKILDSLADHVDMSMHPIEKNVLVVSPNLYSNYKHLEKFGLKIIKGNTELSNKYPNDICYNCLNLGDYFIHNIKYTDNNILDYYSYKGIKGINVKQGYTKCSVLIVDDNHFVTSDKFISKQLKNIGKEVLLINQGFIELKGMNYGMIGGCGGNYSPKDIILTGRLFNHPDCQRIITFIENAGVNIHYLSDDPIEDVGSIFCFKV
ncbi:MAG: hypothetical protein H5T96_04190 [Tissierellales bacterium]|nr:hypothetical protein [Tissierellales bacterium]